MEHKIVEADGTQLWYHLGKLHRKDGPAVIGPTGNKKYYLDGELHREDGGPAIIRKSGYMAWYRNGFKHREDGPAIVYPDGRVEWWLRDGRYYYEYWIKVTPAKDKDKMLLVLKYG